LYSIILCHMTWVSAENVTFEFVVLDGTRIVSINDFEEWVDEFSFD